MDLDESGLKLTDCLKANVKDHSLIVIVAVEGAFTSAPVRIILQPAISVPRSASSTRDSGR